MAIIVRRFAAHEWLLYRDLRLRALADSPDAFGSTFDREVARSDEEWRGRLSEGARSHRVLPLVAVSDEMPVGLAWSRLDDEEPDVAHLFQLWVAPEHRGKGIGSQLLEAVLAWAPSTGASVLRLGVTRGDSAAVRLYRRAGFVDAGEPQPLRPGSKLLSQPMHLTLKAASDDRSG
jgi:ribosomal protein S18 acetylase RimI-like enzyme